jgi:prepilin-type N-terminal cleavage/methylation domain-containing protein
MDWTGVKPMAASTRKSSGFTLIELLIVIVIIAMMLVLITPTLMRTLTSSRVKQTCSIVFAALFRARSEALRHREPVAVFYGDDPTRLAAAWAPPLSDVLPANGSINAWTVKTSSGTWADSTSGNTYTNRNTDNTGDPYGGDRNKPVYPDGTTAPLGTYPFYIRQRPLNTVDLTFDQGVRIITGWYNEAAGGIRNWNNNHNWGGMTPVYEIKRHNSVYSRSGAIITYGGSSSAKYILIYDKATGENCVIDYAEWRAVSRPRIITDASGMPKTITHTGLPSAPVKLDSLHEIDKRIP